MGVRSKFTILLPHSVSMTTAHASTTTTTTTKYNVGFIVIEYKANTVYSDHLNARLILWTPHIVAFYVHPYIRQLFWIKVNLSGYYNRMNDPYKRTLPYGHNNRSPLKPLEQIELDRYLKPDLSGHYNRITPL